jgi:3-(3-hydroxy-phenyl)propionate hydroxylase
LSIGSRLRGDNAFQRWRRRNQLRFVMAVPRLKERARRQSLRRPALVDGFRDARSPDAGTPFPQFMVRRGGVVMRLDDVIGYRCALILARGACSAGDVEWATRRGIVLVRLGLDVDDVGGRISAWLDERGVEFALVRPDRHIFSTGRAGDIPRARTAFDAWSVERPA